MSPPRPHIHLTNKSQLVRLRWREFSSPLSPFCRPSSPPPRTPSRAAGHKADAEQKQVDSDKYLELGVAPGMQKPESSAPKGTEIKLGCTG